MKPWFLTKQDPTKPKHDLEEFVKKEFQPVTSYDNSLPILDSTDYSNLYHTMGGAQTNAFIEQEVWSKIKLTDLPDTGTFIPSPTYLELEPGTQYWNYDKKKKHDDHARKPYIREWEYQVSQAKMLTVQETSSTQGAPEMQHLSIPHLRRKKHRTNRLAQLAQIRETTWDCVQSKSGGVYTPRRSI